MRTRTAVTAFALSAASLLSTAVSTAPAAAGERAPDVRIGLIAETTAKCLGMPAKAPLKGIPDLTTFTVGDLARFRSPGMDRCVQAIKDDKNNPVNALIEKLNAAKGTVPKPPGAGSGGARRAPAEELGPQAALLEGSLNKSCLNLPSKIDAQSILSLVNVGVQDVNVLSNPQNQQCIEKASEAKGDEALSHILSNIPVLSGNLSPDG
ncbi:rodlin [Streptomyces sp. NPDC018029]|uniref:rodlin n=1 Tax=Streptomyces sp. NPDC018029 TaxID=3365032 RepID=UPI0037A814B6